MKLASLLLLSSYAFAQSPPAPASAPLQNWAGLGTQYGTSDSPHFSGWAALALPLSQSQSIYSYTEYMAIPVKGKPPTTSTTTGLATILRTIHIGDKTLYILGLATAGAAVSSTATTGSFQGGGGAFLRWTSGFTVEVVVQQSKAAGPAKPEVLAGVGFAWGK
jgi:hypothetical protein